MTKFLRKLYFDEQVEFTPYEILWGIIGIFREILVEIEGTLWIPKIFPEKFLEKIFMDLPVE